MGIAAVLSLMFWWLYTLGVIPAFLRLGGIEIPYSQPDDLSALLAFGVFF